ncbi:MAG: hypothetical protein JXQ90_18305 [Cyclobacteriaceae bacterium]
MSSAINGRPAMLTVACGETDVGKSYRNQLEAATYCRNNHITRKKAGRVLAFANQDKDYPSYKSVDPDYIHKLKPGDPRKIRPFNKNGSRMTHSEKKETVKKVLRNFRSGLLLLDDIDDYMVFERGQEFVSSLISLCHDSVDVIMTHQSIGKISKTAFQNCTYLRLHHQVDEAKAYKDRIPNYPLVRIAQFIVNEQYDRAYDAHKSGQIDQKEFKVRSSFFVYVNLRKSKVKGCSKAAFVRAAKKFIDQEESSKIRMMMNEKDFKSGKPVYANNSEATLQLVKDYLRNHEEDISGLY